MQELLKQNAFTHDDSDSTISPSIKDAALMLLHLPCSFPGQTTYFILLTHPINCFLSNFFIRDV
jgi:hypothetical protein